MLHYETIKPDTLHLLEQLQSLDSLKDCRLVGGTSLALQIGHRESIDLDLFGTISADIEELCADISEFAEVKPISSTKHMRFLIVNGVKVDIVGYPYPWIDEPVQEDSIKLAGIKDIAAMKLSAITNRGTKKDFIDYYFLLQQFSLKEMIGFYSTKYSDAQLFTAIKSLTYFDDAESDPMPKMITNIEWEQIKMRIRDIAEEYVRSGAQPY